MIGSRAADLVSPQFNRADVRQMCPGYVLASLCADLVPVFVVRKVLSEMWVREAHCASESESTPFAEILFQPSLSTLTSSVG